MKRLSLLLTCLLCAGVLLSGCKKDDNAKPTIVGMWILKSVKVENYHYDQLKDSRVMDTEDESLFAEFRSDGQGTANFMTGEVSTDAYYISADGKYFTDSDGDIGEDDISEIKKLTATDLVVVSTFKTPLLFEKDVYTFTFKRK